LAAQKADQANLQNTREPLVANNSLAQSPPAPVAQAPTQIAQSPAAAPPAQAATAKAPQPALDPAEAARLLRNAEPAPAPRNRESAPAPSREATQIAAQPMLQNVKADKASELFGFKHAKGPDEEVAPDAPRKPASNAAEAAAKPNGLQANRDTAADKPAADSKKATIVPADALNFARAPISVQ
jgi:hypothetical protein